MEKTQKIKLEKLAHYSFSASQKAWIRGGSGGRTMQKVVDVRGMGKR